MSVDKVVEIYENNGFEINQDDIPEIKNTINENVIKIMDNNMSENEAIQYYIEELENGDTLERKGGGGTYKYIGGGWVGDIIWTNNPYTPWNHVALVYNSSTSSGRTVEALSNGVINQCWNCKRSEYSYEVYSVKYGSSSRPSYSVRKSVVDWAQSKRGKGYDYDFANNKSYTFAENVYYNCSELVWKAYKTRANIDLDSNGGPRVYPNNIRDHWTTGLVKRG